MKIMSQSWRPKRSTFWKLYGAKILAATALVILFTAGVTNAIVANSYQHKVAEQELTIDDFKAQVHQQANDLSRQASIIEKSDRLKEVTQDYIDLYAATFVPGKSDKEIEANIPKLVEKRAQVNQAITEYEQAKQ